MSIELFLYLADAIPRIGTMGIFIAFLSLVASFMLAMFADINEEKRLLRWLRLTIPMCVVCGLIGLLTPSRQTMYLMAGASIAKDAINSSVGKKVQTLIEQELEKLIKK